MKRKAKKAYIFERKFLCVEYEDSTLVKIDLERLFNIEFVGEKEKDNE